MRHWLQFNLKPLFLAVLVAADAAMAFERYWITRPLFRAIIYLTHSRWRMAEPTFQTEN